MKSVCIFLFSLWVCSVLCACRKSDSKQKTTSALCGTRSYHFHNAGYNPLMHTYQSDSGDITVAIDCITTNSVIIGQDTFVLDSVLGTGVRHYLMQPPKTIAGSGYLLFDPMADTVFIYTYTASSGGLGHTESVYRSL